MEFFECGVKVGAECLGCHRQGAPAILRKTTLMIMRWLIILRLHRNELTCGHELCLRHMNWLRHELYLRYIISGRVRLRSLRLWSKRFDKNVGQTPPYSACRKMKLPAKRRLRELPSRGNGLTRGGGCVTILMVRFAEKPYKIDKYLC